MAIPGNGNINSSKHHVCKIGGKNHRKGMAILEHITKFTIGTWQLKAVY